MKVSLLIVAVVARQCIAHRAAPADRSSVPVRLAAHLSRSPSLHCSAVRERIGHPACAPLAQARQAIAGHLHTRNQGQLPLARGFVPPSHRANTNSAFECIQPDDAGAVNARLRIESNRPASSRRLKRLDAALTDALFLSLVVRSLRRSSTSRARCCAMCALPSRRIMSTSRRCRPRGTGVTSVGALCFCLASSASRRLLTSNLLVSLFLSFRSTGRTW